MKRKLKKILKKIFLKINPSFFYINELLTRVSLLENNVNYYVKKVDSTFDRFDGRSFFPCTNNIYQNLNGDFLTFQDFKKGIIRKYNLNVTDFFVEIKKYLLKTDVLIDIGCGIRPEIFFEPVVHICIEPFKQYRDVIKPYFPNRSYFLFMKTGALEAIKDLDNDSVDSVFMFDLIEHLTKEDGLELIKEADRVARKQVVVFTPLGFYPMFYKNKKDKDAWGLKGIEVQEHKSGWTPDDFDKTWNFHICKDFHDSFLPDEKKNGKKYSAMMAIKTKKFRGFPKNKDTPEFVKNLYNERVKK